MRTFVAELLMDRIQPITSETTARMESLTPDEVIAGSIGVELLDIMAQREENVALTPAAISAFIKSGMLTEEALTQAEVF